MTALNAKEHELATLWRHFVPLLRADLLACSVMINILALGLPLLTLQVYDRIIPNQAVETFRVLVLALVVILLIEAVLKVIRAWLAGWAGARYEHWASILTMNRLLASQLEALEKVPAGEHLDRLSGVDAIRDFYASQASLAIVDVPFVVLFLILLAVIGGPLVLVPLVILLIAGWLALSVGRQLRRAIRERGVWDDRRYNFVIETLSGIHTVKGVSMEPLMQRRYERLMSSNAETGHQVTLMASVLQGLSSSASQATFALTAAVGAWFVLDGRITIGALAACILLAGRTIQPVVRALLLWTRYQSVLVAEGKIAALQDIPVEGEAGGTLTDPIETIEVRGATFRFDPDGPAIFEDLNFKVSVGEIIGVQGDNGCGKSSFLRLLMGRVRLEAGEVLFNGEPAAAFDRQDTRKQFAYLAPRPVLMTGTVLENLTFFRDGKAKDTALYYASRLGLDAIFARMPDGYDTVIRDAAATSIPGGVAQRIVIARMLAMKPRFLLFDEANNALDFEGEQLLKSLLVELKDECGIVLVTYRPSLMALTSRQYRLSDRQAHLITPDAVKSGGGASRGA